MMYPELTTEGFAASRRDGNTALEFDARVLADGSLGMMHDGTVDRTTTSTGSVAALDQAGYLALDIDADTWFGTQAWGNALTPPVFADMLADYRGRTLLLPEAKVGSDCAAAVCAALTAAAVDPMWTLIQSFDLAEAGVVVAAGYPACYLTEVDTDIAAVQAAGIEWVGVSNGAAASVFQNWVAAGLKVLVYAPNRRYRRSALLAYGVSGLFTDDPQYVRADGPLATADTFSRQTWMPGMLAISDGQTVAIRGKFTAPDYWGWDNAADTGFRSVMMGWACPIKNSLAPTEATIEFSVIFDSANAGDATRWASVFLSKNDEAFTDGAAGNVNQQGFHFLLRKSGVLSILKRTTSSMTQMTFTNTIAITDGEEVRFRIVYSSAGVSLHRLNAEGEIAYSASYADVDPALRGGYMHMSRAGLACRFRDISIT